MNKKKIPMRMCISCREMKPKKDLLRVVRNPAGEVFLDATFKANGRGAYLCLSDECVKKCNKAKLLNKQLEAEVPEQLFEDIRKKINERQD